jgi:hypothetical protein
MATTLDPTAPAPIPTPAPTPAPAPAAGTGMMYAAPSPAPAPANPLPVDFNTETVEGRVGNILKTDDRGNYTNPVVRQAVDRQMQAFNERGLLNSSMAVQAGQEAAISKAADIAAADAQTYNRANQADRDWQRSEWTRQNEQNFSLRKDYQTAVQNVSTNYQKMVDTINSSNMTPEDKNVAIVQAQAVRDGEMTYQNNLYSRMPAWRNEWLTAAVPVHDSVLGDITNRDTLANIANDPAQPQYMRDSARQKLAELQASARTAAAAAAAAPAPVTAPSAYYSDQT